MNPFRNLLALLVTLWLVGGCSGEALGGGDPLDGGSASDAGVNLDGGSDANPRDASTGDATLADANSGDSGDGNDSGAGLDSGTGTDGGTMPPSRYSLLTSLLVGGNRNDRAQGVHIDRKGFIYLGGQTRSTNFPTTAGAFDRSRNSSGAAADGFVAKFSPTGTLLWSTLLGGTRRDQVYQVRVDGSGNVYAVGSTGSNDFLFDAASGTPGFDQQYDGPTTSNGYGDAFVVKLSSDGGSVLFWTYLGGSGVDTSRGNLHLAQDGSIYVSGRTTSRDFPIPAGMSPPPFQRNHAGDSDDAFVVKISGDGRRLLKATYLGGSKNDLGYGGVHETPDGAVVVAGATQSSNFVGVSGFHGGAPGSTHANQGDGFVVKLSANLSQLRWATYLGGPGHDAVLHNQGMTVDALGRVVVLMSTSSTNLPRTIGSPPGGNDEAYVAILSVDGAGIDAARYVGGSGVDYPSGIITDPTTGMVFFTGRTSSPNYPTTSGALGTRLRGAHDVFFTALGPDLSMVYSTLLEGAPGGSAAEDQRGRSVWVSPNGNVCISGVVSPNYPSTGQVGNLGQEDGFMTCFSPAP